MFSSCVAWPSWCEDGSIPKGEGTVCNASDPWRTQSHFCHISLTRGRHMGWRNVLCLLMQCNTVALSPPGSSRFCAAVRKGAGTLGKCFTWGLVHQLPGVNKEFVLSFIFVRIMCLTGDIASPDVYPISVASRNNLASPQVQLSLVSTHSLNYVNIVC